MDTIRANQSKLLTVVHPIGSGCQSHAFASHGQREDFTWKNPANGSEARSICSRKRVYAPMYDNGMRGQVGEHGKTGGGKSWR